MFTKKELIHIHLLLFQVKRAFEFAGIEFLNFSKKSNRQLSGNAKEFLELEERLKLCKSHSHIR
jgi:hypothetical protein